MRLPEHALQSKTLDPYSPDRRKNYVLVPEGELPQLVRMIRMQDADVFAIAERCQVTFEDLWKSATHAGSQRLSLAYWRGRHTTEQLKALVEELKPNSGDIEKRARQLRDEFLHLSSITANSEEDEVIYIT